MIRHVMTARMKDIRTRQKSIASIRLEKRRHSECRGFWGSGCFPLETMLFHLLRDFLDNRRRRLLHHGRVRLFAEFPVVLV